MATVDELKHDSGFKNYLSVFIALQVTGDCLETFTENGLKSVHQQITDTLGNLPRCNQNCSQLNRAWCRTCTKWQRELSKFAVSPRQIVWTKMHSRNWPNGFVDIAEVFVPSGYNNNGTNLRDLSTQMNVWIKCLEFTKNINKLAIDLKTERNLIAHCSSYKLTNNEKQRAFQSIDNVLKVPDIVKTILNYQDVQRTLTDLEQNDLYQHETYTKRAIDEIKTDINEIRRAGSWKLPLTSVFALLIVILALVVYNFWPFHQESGLSLQHAVSEEGCLAETIHPFVKHGIALSEYLAYHKQLIGREKILQNLENNLRNITDRKGVIVSADMGYGKTALMSHIICATKQQKGFGIRKRLLAYHICRFDVKKTKQVHVFIYRLLSFILTAVPDLNAILQNAKIHACRDYLENEECIDDKFGCIDQCLLFPLRKVNSPYPEKPFFIIIDALDECDDTLTDENAIEHLLKHRISQFPKWIKFIITTRYKHLSKEFRANFKSVYLRSNDSSNIQDIEEYIQSSFSNIKVSLLKENTWNFQLITSIIDGNITDLTEIPHSTSLAYELRFESVFHTYYEHSKIILEVLCSTHKPLTEVMLWEIVSNVTDLSRNSFDRSIEKLMPFMKPIVGEILFGHMSFKMWLETNENKKYQISISHGHQQHAIFLLTQIENKYFNFDLLDLAIHTANSNSETVRIKIKNMSNFTLIQLEKFQTEYILHRLARLVDNADVCELVLWHFNDSNKLNKVGSSAAFVAAAFGHTHTFECLVNHGADLNFRKSGIPPVIDFALAVDIALEHTHWGYGLLDIAAQNGRTNIVEFILKMKTALSNSLFNKVNDLNLLPIHLAFKYGHTDIINILGSAFKWMLDNKCLYYASKFGDMGLVEYLVEGGVKDKCIRCDSKLYWLPSNSTRVQGRMVAQSKTVGVLFDDWNLIACETALNIAIRTNKTAIAKFLIDRNVSSLHCRDRGGRTAMISTIQYDRQEIGKIIMNRKEFSVKESCNETPQLSDMTSLSDNEIRKLHHYFCDPGTTLSHIAAKFDRLWFFEVIKSFKLMKSLTYRDNFGCYPVHFAACHDHTSILKYYKEHANKLMDMYSVACSNGSLPIHSAAVCGSVESVNLLSENGGAKVYNLTETMNIAMHAVSRNIDMVASESITTQTNSSTMIEKFILRQNQLLQEDINGRNIFHFAILNGHFQIINDLFTKYPSTSTKCLSMQDTFSKAPMQLAIDGMKMNTKVRFNVVTVFRPDKLKYFKYRLLDHLTAKEYSIFKTLEFLNNSNQRGKCVPRTIINSLIQKMSYPLVPLILHSNLIEQKLTDVNIIKLLSTMIKHDHTRIMTLDFIHTSMFLLQPKMTCGLSLKKSFYHLIALYYSKSVRDLHYGSLLDLNENICKGFRVYFSSDFLSKCYDDEGFNVLERSIQGSYTELTRCLLAYNVVSKKNVSDILRMPNNVKLKYDKFTIVLKDFNENITELTLTKTKDTSFVNRNVKPEVSAADNTTAMLIGIYSKHVTEKILCQNNANVFSIVHIWAMEDMKKTLEEVKSIYGADILKCSNIDQFTPLYLANIFDNANTVEYLESQNVTLVDPTKSAQKFFLLQIHSRFYFDKNRHAALSCTLDENVFGNRRKRLSTYKCFKKAKTNLPASQHLVYAEKQGLTLLKFGLMYLSHFELLTNILKRRLLLFHNRTGKTLPFPEELIDDNIIKEYADIFYRTCAPKEKLRIETICNSISRTNFKMLKYTQPILSTCKDDAKIPLCQLAYDNELNTFLKKYNKKKFSIYNCLDFIYSKRDTSIISNSLRKLFFKHRKLSQFKIGLYNLGVNYVGSFCYQRFKNVFKRLKTDILTSTDWVIYQTRYRYLNDITSLQSYHDKFMYQNRTLTWPVLMDIHDFIAKQISYLLRKSNTVSLEQKSFVNENN